MQIMGGIQGNIECIFERILCKVCIIKSVSGQVKGVDSSVDSQN